MEQLRLYHIVKKHQKKAEAVELLLQFFKEREEVFERELVQLENIAAIDANEMRRKEAMEILEFIIKAFILLKHRN